MALVNHFHINRWSSTLLVLVCWRFLTYCCHIQALCIRITHLLHFTTSLCRLGSDTYLVINISLLHFDGFTFHLSSRRSFNACLRCRIVGWLLCWVQDTILSLIAIDLRYCLLYLCHINHRLLIWCIWVETSISLRYKRVRSRSSNYRLRLCCKFFLSDSTDWLLYSIFLYLLLKLLNMSLLTLIQDVLLVGSWDSSHIFLHDSLIQGYFS